MKKKSSNGIVAYKTLGGIVGVIFGSAAILLGLLSAFDVYPESSLAILLISLLLALVAGPSVYWYVYANACAAEPTQDMSALTVTDTLTHVMNRRGITMGVLEAMAQAERYNTPLSVAIIDVDHLKRTNDEFGRAAGDKVLTDLAGVLADTLRMPDKIGRYGGEEFLAVLPHTAIAPAKKIAERIRSAVDNAKLTANGKRVNLTVSVGVTQYTKGADLEHLLSRANAAVDEAKRNGGNRVAAKSR